jgi:hypothetical protein
MFIPNEGVYSAALEAEPTLLVRMDAEVAGWPSAFAVVAG